MDGYLYCFSNASMTGILKVGMTQRNPKDRLKEANDSDTWRPPTPYCLEFAKEVSCPKEKEKTMHHLLEKYTERIHPRREFFRTTPEEVRVFFDLMDGNYWDPSIEPLQTDTNLDDSDSIDPIHATDTRRPIERLPMERRSLSPRHPKLKMTSINPLPGVEKKAHLPKERPGNLKECFKRDTLLHHKKKGIDAYAMFRAIDGFVYLSNEKMEWTEGIWFRTLNAFTNHNYSERNKREGIERTLSNNAYIELIYKNDEGLWRTCDEIVSKQILTQ